MGLRTAVQERKNFVRTWTFTRWLCLLSLLLCGAALHGCDSSESIALPTEGRALRATTEDEFGQVFLSRTAARARVDVLAVGSSQPLTSFTTNAAGIFIIPAGSSLPHQFRLSAQTPEGVQVERYVDDADDMPYLWLNIPSHLISLTIASHPELSQEQAEDRVRAGLSIPEGAGLYGISDGPSSPFSHTLFQARAEAAGGFETFCADLVAGMEQGRVTSFKVSHGLDGFANPTTLLARVAAQLEVLAGAAASLGKYLLHETAGIIVDSGLEYGIGKITAVSGSNFGTANKFDNIENQLASMQSDIDSLSDTVNKDFLVELTNEDENSLNQVLTSLKAANTALQNQASEATQRDSQVAADVFDHGPNVLLNNTSALLTAFTAVIDGKAQLELTNFLTSSSPSQNLLSLAAQQQSLKLGISNPSSEYVYYPLRRDDLTDQLNTNFNLYTGWMLLLSSVLSENGNAYYLPSLGSPPAFKVNEALQDIIELAGTLQRAQQSVPESVGSPQVLMDLDNGLMWYFPATLGKYDVAQNGMVDLVVGNWGLPPGVQKPAKVGNSVGKDLVNFKRPPDLRGWRLPEHHELTTLRTRVLGLQGGSNESKTLAALQTLGFTGLSDPDETDHSNFKKYWFNGSCTESVQPDGNGPVVFTYFDMDSGQNGSETTSIFDPDADPLYTAIYVRTIEGLDDAHSFGDTGNQIDRSYDYGPDSMLIQPVTSILGSDPTTLTFVLNGNHDNLSVTSDMTSRAEWSLTSVSPDAVAFLNFDVETTPPSHYQTVPGQQLVEVIFRGQGTAVLQAKARNGVTATHSVSVQTKPTLTSIFVSPQNFAFSTIPNPNQSMQFYCTGYLSSGEAVDLTNLVEWSVLPDDSTHPVAAPLDPSMAQFEVSGDSAGLLVFGSTPLTPPEPYVRAVYDPTEDDGLALRNFRLTDLSPLVSDARFAIPHPQPPK